MKSSELSADKKENFEDSRYGMIGLLVCMVSLLVVVPFFQDSLMTRIFFNLFFTGILIFSVVPFVNRIRPSLIISLTLAIPTLVVHWGLMINPGFWEFFPGVENLLSMLFTGFVIFVLLAGIVRARRVDTNLIFGSVCVYLLIGLEFGFIYGLMEDQIPGTFKGMSPDLSASSGDPHWDFPQYLYFSFTTLTTLGYGDITPLTNPARMMTSIQAMTGQFYIAILVARLIGIQLSGESKS